MLNNIKKWAGLMVGVTLIATPIGLYIDKFGLGYWAEHQKWAELGTYIGGVVTPILTFITIAFLLLQLKYLALGLESERNHRVQTDTNSEIDYFINLIEIRVANLEADKVKSFITDQTTVKLDDTQSELAQLWNCVYIALMPFRDEQTFENQLKKAIIKIRAVIGHQKAEYLDKLLKTQYSLPKESLYFS
ncbi:MAG: hypothetical protein CMK63_01320 [Pseudoalteromonadaceae bacterium]|nr:hypothetical protein [Pseudoalteromonadaceae bacterium]